MAGHSSVIKRNNTVSGLDWPGMLLGALSLLKGHFSLSFLPLRHSISQHFIVLLMGHAPKRIAAVVEQMEDVTADQLSSQVALFGMMHFRFGTFF